MTDSRTRDVGSTGINPYVGDHISGPIYLPDNQGASADDDRFVLRLMAKSLARRPPIDSRLKEALRPVVSDISVLKPEKYRALLRDTHAALLKQNRNEREEEAKEVLSDLIALLEENSSLNSLLDQYANLIQKA